MAPVVIYENQVEIKISEIDEMKKQIEDLKNQMKRPHWNVSG